ncbi:hypothetical protein CFHF_19605 [Caulobacter flavus]|uniref:Uncharacterized protein n=1 Tax=Caulobacter flavus TaxID=1679497 RepID=A0A2N5CNY5_9CAUL|nr:hypothetical protein [Caulobacter flavus]AYV48619.1 hypothetical protein C1707_21460 [Caulobacter flavus]PLR08665.1 hypothetical protein CFHF_19605 [Caulobacter flavus]
MAGDSEVVIDRVSFMSLHHHDGRFVRGAGLFAFARRDPDGGRTIFCLELAQDISREAVSGHRAWSHALTRGMNEVLVHLAGTQSAPGEILPGAQFPPLRYDLYDDVQVGDREGDQDEAGDETFAAGQAE